MTTTFSGARARARRGPRLPALLLLALAACGDGGGGNDLVVNDPVTRVELASASATVQVGGTMQMTATGYTFTGAAATGRSVAWSSTNEGVATVSGTGMVTAVAPGAATIRARIGDAVGSRDITVAVIPVASVAVAPETATLVAGNTVTIAATLRDAGGNALTGRTVAWTALEPSVAAVNAQGVVTGVAAGTGRIVATAEGRADTATVTVLPAVASVEVTPGAPTIVVGGTAQLTATARDAGGAALTGRAVAWAALDPSIATVSAQGVVTAVAPGQGRITATVEGRSAQVTVTVVSVPVATVEISPASPSVFVAFTTQLTAIARDAQGNALTGRAVTWAALDPSIATVSAQGVVTGVSAGQGRITATVEGKTAQVAVTVTPAPVATVEITPASPSVFVAFSIVLTAAARDANGNLLTGRPVAWSSLDPQVATVSPQGTVTGVAVGQARIVATVEGKTAQVTVSVDPAPVNVVVVTPATATIAVGGTVQLSASARDANNNPLTGRAVTWTSLNPSVATVSASGLVTAAAIGEARVVGSVGSRTDTAVITVTAVPVATVEISPAAPSVLTGETVQLTAVAKDAAGATLTGRAVTWAALDPAVATVGAQGVVTGVSAGQGRITATVEGKTAQVTVTVTAPTPTRVEVAPRFAAANAGTATSLTATAYTAAGTAISGQAVEFTVVGSGLSRTVTGAASASVTGTLPGVFRVEAEARPGVTDTAVVAVLGTTSILSTAFAGGEILRSVQPGQTITIPVTLDLSRVSANGDLGSAQLELEYDPAILTFTGHAAGVQGGVLDVNAPTPGTVRVAYANTSVIGSAQLTLVNLTFQVAAGATAGARRQMTLTYTAAPTSTSFAAYSVPISVAGRIVVAAPSSAARRARRVR